MREGLVKHDTDYDQSDAEGYEPELAGTLECQLANIADEMAWNTSDLDDGLYAGILDVADLAEQPLWQRVMDSLGLPYHLPRLDSLTRARIIRRLVGIEMTDAIEYTYQQLVDHNIQSVDDIRRMGRNLAGFSPDMRQANGVQKRYLYEHFYRSHRVMRMASKAEMVLTRLFEAYVREPRMLPPDTQQKIQKGDETMHRVICDYLAGMTDRYAIQEYNRLFDPNQRV